MQIVVFKLGEEFFGVETLNVQNISDMMEITKVPNAPSYIKGLINLRGNIISLLDLNLLLENNHLTSEQSNVIILDIESEQIGITVDFVQEVIELEENTMQKLDSSKGQGYIKGILNLEDKIVTIIDINKLLNP